MANYCGKCGGKLDNTTGRCPNCDTQGGTSQQITQQVHQSGYTSKQKKSSFGYKLILTLVIIVSMAAGAVGVMALMDIGGSDGGAEDNHIHSWSDATCTAPKTCRVCGETKGQKLAHTWTPTTCTDASVCSACGAKGTPATGHNWSDGTCVNPGKCISCGVVDSGPQKHRWQNATYNDPKTCEDCGATEGSKKTPSSALDIRDIISHASASSVYTGDKQEHYPSNLYDEDPKTNWTEGVAGNGIGEYVLLEFDNTYAVKKLWILVGCHYDNSGVHYDRNCRPKVITLSFSDGSSERISLSDTLGGETITLDRYYYTDYIKITIEEVYTGTTHPDTVIAELDVTAYKP